MKISDKLQRNHNTKEIKKLEARKAKKIKRK